MQNYPYVFISYSTIDAEVAESIASLLEVMDIEYFLDKKEIQWGDRIEGTIRKKIGDCSHLVVIVSPASVQSPWVPYEVGQARALDKILLPYLTHPSINLPSFLANLHYVSEMEGVRAFFDKLSREQGKHRRVRPTPKPGTASGETDEGLKETPAKVSAYLNRNALELPQLIRTARYAIDILAITLESTHELVSELTNVLRENGELRMRVLLLDPDSDYTSARANQLSMVRRQFREEARSSVETLANVCAKHSDRAEIRLYEALPTQMMFRFDDVLVVSVYSSARLTRNLVHLKFTADMRKVQETFFQHFEILWTSASVPPFAHR